MPFEPLPPIHLDPVEVAAETFLLRSAQPALGAPLSVGLNSLVIRGSETIVVDTGTVADRAAWLDDLTSLVDPADVSWVFLSHDDEDHTGNLAIVLEMCPAATLVTSWAATERMACSFGIPPERLRWIHDGDTFEMAGRNFLATRPPVFDSPTTRALLDLSSGVLWASDAFATPMPAEPVDTIDQLPPQLWQEGTALFHHHALSPWLSMVDTTHYAAAVDRFRALDPDVIVSAHAPVIRGPSIDVAFAHLAGLPSLEPPPHPEQPALDAALAGRAVP